ncbi:hypothetical protein Agub_g197, partial [Astrephomene gubernaculifera]
CFQHYSYVILGDSPHILAGLALAPLGYPTKCGLRCFHYRRDAGVIQIQCYAVNTGNSMSFTAFSGEVLGVRAYSATVARDGFFPFYGTHGGYQHPPAQMLGGIGTAGASSPQCFLGSAANARRSSQCVYGQHISPMAARREPEASEERFSGCPARPTTLAYVMLPLDTVNSEGVFRYAGSAWFSQALQLLVASGVHGVAMDFWWGAVERSPGQYNWSGYKQALEVIKQTGLKVQAVLSFHACGGNVGDTVQIPLPEWVLQAGEADPDLFFADRPRNGRRGNRNREYISIWADDAPGVLRGRSPMQCYEDFMASLRDNFSMELGAVIDELVVGSGPCGELRLPSYVEANGWRFPGAGEFQCYDRRALASLAQAAREAGHPEWGYTGPHDAGEYNSTPEHTGFFSQNGSWNTPYGRFFLEWYSNCLLKHGERLLTVANQVFAAKRPCPPSLSALQTSGSSMLLQPCFSQGLQPSPAGARASNASLNRLLEAGCGSDPSASECGSMRPPSVSLPRRNAAEGSFGTSSISPSCTCSSMSTYMGLSSGGSGYLPAGQVQAAVGIGAGACQPMQQLAATAGGSASSFASPRMMAFAAHAELHLQAGSGCAGLGGDPTAAAGLGSGASCSGTGGSQRLSRVSAATAAMASAVSMQDVGVGAAAGATAGGGSTGSGPNHSGSGVFVAVAADALMTDIEPSEASHTSLATMRDALLEPPLSLCGDASGPLCQQPATGVVATTAPCGGPSLTSSGVQCRSSASMITESEPMYGQGTAYMPATTATVAAAAAANMACSSAVRMDVYNSLSSLSTECTTTGVGAHTQGVMFLDVAASLAADGDDESDIGTSCCTAVAPEEADDLFSLAAAAGRGGGCLSEHAAVMLAQSSPFNEDGRTSSNAGLGMGIDRAGSCAAPVTAATVVAPAAPASASSMLSPLPSCLAPAAATASSPAGGHGLHLALKIAGIHWWYRSRSHAAELTAGYYNVDGRDGYAAIVELCARHRANLVLTCVEMCDSQHPMQAQCGPEGLLRQLRQLAARAGVSLSGENALPIFSSGGVDTDALDRIVQNARAWPSPTSARNETTTTTTTTGFSTNPITSLSAFMPHGGAHSAHQLHLPTAAPLSSSFDSSNIVCAAYRMSESGRMVQVESHCQPLASCPQLPQEVLPQHAVAGTWPGTAYLEQPGCIVPSPAAGAAAAGSSSPVLPGLRAFTFLRLVPEMLLPGYQTLWLRFMGKLASTS